MENPAMQDLILNIVEKLISSVRFGTSKYFF